MNIIKITVAGPAQSGKSAIAASIRELLERAGYCVAIPSREERLNPSQTLSAAKSHERPRLDETVVVLHEQCEAGMVS